MALLSLTTIDVVVDLVTIAIVILALYFILRQRLNRLFDAKVALAVVYVAFLGGMLLELLRDFTTAASIITYYTFGEIGLILLIVMLLTLGGYTLYFKPSEQRFSGRLREMFSARWPQGVMLALVGAYFVFIWVYLVAVRPFTIVDVSVGGSTVAAPRFGEGFLGLLLGVLVVYVLYAYPLFLLGAGAARSPEVRRALVVLPTSWIAVGAILLLFNGVLLEADLNLIVLGHLALGAIFAITALVFRDVDLLGTTFQPISYAFPAAVPVFTKALGIDPTALSGTSTLIEVDPSARYEDSVKDFVVEQLSNNNLVYLFTRKGSPVMSAVSNLPEVRFFVMTDDVSYAQPTGEAHKTAVPLGKPDVIVDVTQKMLAANAKAGNTLVFDNVSEVALAVGDDQAVRLLRRLLSVLEAGKATSLFLITARAQPQEFTRTVGQMFERRLAHDSAGLSRKRI